MPRRTPAARLTIANEYFLTKFLAKSVRARPKSVAVPARSA